MVEGKCWYTMIDCSSFCFSSVAEGVGDKDRQTALVSIAFNVVICSHKVIICVGSGFHISL